jgi:hypothetical protein
VHLVGLSHILAASVSRLKQAYCEIEFYGAENFRMLLFVTLIMKRMSLCICVSLLFYSVINIGVT